MSEQMKVESDGKDGHEVYFTRHSKAGYRTYTAALKSEQPEAPFDASQQITPDLTEQGVELAKTKAAEFLNTLDPERDALFFASSEEARALETANAYRQAARERGFEIIIPTHVAPEHISHQYAEQIGEGEIRVVSTLGTGIENQLLSSIFNPASHLGDINWDAVSPEMRERWDAAREIIDGDDQGSWGANFFQHSEELQKIFPELDSARDEFDLKFQNLRRLVRFGITKAEGSGIDKNVKILAFGHESYVGHALDTYFKEHDLANCESISIGIDNENEITIGRRGASKTLEE